MRFLFALLALLLPASVLAQQIPDDLGGISIAAKSAPEGRANPRPLAATAYTLNLKGILYDSNNSPLPDGYYTAQFRLYTISDRTQTNIGPVFTETQNVKVSASSGAGMNRPDRKGNYAVTLGNQSGNTLPSSLFASQTLWLEIWINGAQPPSTTQRQQILQIPSDSAVATSMNQVIWVTNALNNLEANNALETAALAFYVRQVYATNPAADPTFVIRSLIRAESVFNQRYRSQTTGNFRAATNPLDAVVNMYGTLINQTGDPVTLSLIGESLRFAAGTLDLTNGGKNSGQSPYQQFSYELGRITATASFNDYTTTQLEGVYLLARNNSNAAQVVNTFFGYGYNAKVSDSLFTILNNNPALFNSPNFAPLYSQIETDGAMLSTLDTTNANIADFFDRMTMATQTLTTAFSQITTMQSSDYVGSINNQTTGAMVSGIFTTAINTTSPMLRAANSSTYIVKQIQLKSDATYNALLLQQAQLSLAVASAQYVGDTMGAALEFSEPLTGNPGQAAQFAGYAVADSFNIAAANIGIQLNAPTLTQPTGVIQDGLTQISGQLAGVASQLNGRLDIMDANLLNFYNQTNQNFALLNYDLQQGFADIGARIDTLVNNVVAVQYTLDRLTQDFSTFATQAQRANSLVPALTLINNWGTDPYNYRYTIPGFNYQGNFGACQTYATSTCLQSSPENGNKTIDGFSSQYGDAQITDQLDSNQEKNLNYLLAFAYHRFYLKENTADSIFTPPANDPSALHTLGMSLANPTAWEMSSIGMMRAATIYPDLGLYYIQNTTAFSAAYSIGTNLQNAATSVTLQYASGGKNIQASPILPDMMLHQRLMAANLYQALLAAENGATTTAAQVANVRTALNNTNSAVSLAVKALNGSRRLLEQFIEFGLSRSVKSDAALSSLLYSGGDPTFRDPSGNLAADPNAQKLPDGDWVQSLYHNWVASQPNGSYTYVTGDPAAIFFAAQQERWNVMEKVLDGNLWNTSNTTLITTLAAGHNTYSKLDTLARDANANGLLLGETLADVDAIQSRLSYFLIPSVSGAIGTYQIPKLTGASGNLLTTKSLANTVVTLTFQGTDGVFTANTLLDASGGFTVFVPKGQYTVLVSAPGFLRGTLVAPNAAFIDTTANNAIQNCFVSSVYGPLSFKGLIPGDLTGDNLINIADQVFLRNALNSTPSSSNWNPLADLNGDGKVDLDDMKMLLSNYGRAGK